MLLLFSPKPPPPHPPVKFTHTNLVEMPMSNLDKLLNKATLKEHASK